MTETRSARCECEAANFVFAASNPDILCHAFKVIVELACFNLAGTNPCRAHGSFGVVPAAEKCVAAGMYAVADSDSPSVTIAVEIICALGHAAF